MENAFYKLKEEIYSNGTDYINEFLGYDFNYDLPKEEMDKAMYKRFEQMPQDEKEEYIKEYNIK